VDHAAVCSRTRIPFTPAQAGPRGRPVKGSGGSAAVGVNVTSVGSRGKRGQNLFVIWAVRGAGSRRMGESGQPHGAGEENTRGHGHRRKAVGFALSGLAHPTRPDAVSPDCCRVHGMHRCIPCTLRNTEDVRPTAVGTHRGARLGRSPSPSGLPKGTKTQFSLFRRIGVRRILKSGGKGAFCPADHEAGGISCKKCKFRKLWRKLEQRSRIRESFGST